VEEGSTLRLVSRISSLGLHGPDLLLLSALQSRQGKPGAADPPGLGVGSSRSKGHPLPSPHPEIVGPHGRQPSAGRPD
jgi:hypothetical protein